MSPYNIRGPVVVIREAGDMSGIGHYSDVTPGTFRHFIDNVTYGGAHEVPAIRPEDFRNAGHGRSRCDQVGV